MSDDDQKSDSTYCCFTIFALSIAFCSAVVTFLVANYMYTGLSCNDWPPVDLPKEVETPNSDRFLVPEKQVVVVRMKPLRRCFIIPAKNSNNPSSSSSSSSEVKFRIVEEAIGDQLLLHLAGEKAHRLCKNMSSFILESQPSPSL